MELADGAYRSFAGKDEAQKRNRSGAEECAE